MTKVWLGDLDDWTDEKVKAFNIHLAQRYKRWLNYQIRNFEIEYSIQHSDISQTETHTPNDSSSSSRIPTVRGNEPIVGCPIHHNPTPLGTPVPKGSI
jgi:hypothetical protein